MISVPARPDLLAGEGLPPSPQQSRSRDKRAELIAAALALFGEKGYEATSIQEIAGRAEVAVGGFYQHFRSKRQLLLVLMDELLGRLSELDLRPKGSGDVRAGLHAFLHRSFSTDLAYLGAYRAWREAVLSDTELAHRQGQIEAWTTARVTAAITLWRQLPGARPGVNIPVFARLMDRFFWHLLGQAGRQPRHEFDAMVEATAHLLYHALFTDPPQKRALT